MSRFEQLAKIFYLSTEEVARRFEQLPEREREIMAFRFGLNDGVNRTLEETAEAFKVTRERVRQVEQKSLALLRHPKSPAE